MQRRRAARAMAEGSRFSTPGRDGANALLRQPAEADLIHHRINGGINGGEGPASRGAAIAALIGNAHQRPRRQRAILQRSVQRGERWSRWATAMKSIFISHSRGRYIRRRVNTITSASVRAALVIRVFQHFGEPDLGLRIALLKLA